MTSFNILCLEEVFIIKNYFLKQENLGVCQAFLFNITINFLYQDHISTKNLYLVRFQRLHNQHF